MAGRGAFETAALASQTAKQPVREKLNPTADTAAHAQGTDGDDLVRLFMDSHSLLTPKKVSVQ